MTYAEVMAFDPSHLNNVSDSVRALVMRRNETKGAQTRTGFIGSQVQCFFGLTPDAVTGRGIVWLWLDEPLRASPTQIFRRAMSYVDAWLKECDLEAQILESDECSKVWIEKLGFKPFARLEVFDPSVENIVLYERLQSWA